MGTASSRSTLRQHWRERAPVRLFMNVGVAIGGVVLARFLGLITTVFLIRRMSDEGYGLYTALYTLLGVVIIFSGFGLDNWLLRQGGSPETLRSQIQRTFSLRLFATLALMVVGIALIIGTAQPGMTLALLLASGAALLFELLLTTAHTALRAQNRSQSAAILQVVAAGLYILLLLWLWPEGAKISPDAATGYRMAASGIGIVLMVWMLRNNLRIVWAPRDFVRLAVEARAYFASDILANIALKADLTLVTLLIGTTAAGIYSPALVVINTTFIVPSIAAQVLLPVLSRPTLPQREFRWIVILSIIASVMYGLIWLATLTWQSEWIITAVFQQEFVLPAIQLLQIMAVIPLLKSINFCWVMVMIARDRQGLRTRLQVAGSVFNIIGNLIWIPMFGLVGAAWVNMVTEVLLLACYSYGAWVVLRRRDS